MERIDVASDGDLILVVGDQLELRVYACVLRLTSPVFKAMLGPRFAEGQNPGTSAEPQRLALPEDDVEGMRILCLVLHLANHMLRTTPSSGQLFHFSEMVDKYDCSTAVMHTSRIWLSEQAALGRVDNLHLCSAYLLDDAESFRRLTDLHIRQASNTSREKKLVVDHIGIELKVYEILLAKIEDVRQILGKSITGCVEAMSMHILPQYDHHFDRFSRGERLADGDQYRCKYGEHTLTCNLRGLASAGIWPEEMRTGSSIAEVIEAINDFEMAGERPECDSCAGEGKLDDFRNAITSMKREVNTILTSLCLDCVKNGSTPSDS